MLKRGVNLLPLKVFTLFLYSLALPALSQEKEIVNSYDLIVDAYKEYNEGNLEKAYELYNEVSRNDTNYPIVLTEKIVILQEQEKYEESLILCEEGLKLNSKIKATFYQNKGVGLERLDKYDEAIETYKEGLKYFPKKHALYYNMAIVYRKKEDYVNTLKYLKKSIEVYPYYANAHLELGRLAFKEGKVSQAIMSYIMVILVEPAAERSNNILTLLSAISSSKMEYEPKGITLSENGKDDYSEIDLIIKNYAALHKDYKVKSKIDIPLVRQIQVLFEKLEYDNNDRGFWMQTYVPFYKDIFNNGWFEPFSYYLVKSSDNTKHQKYVKKYASEITKFISWSVNKLREYIANNEVLIGGEKKKISKWFHSGSAKGLLALGDKEGDDFIGCWEIYYTNGALQTKGCYNNDGKRIGDWEWYYETGSIKEKANYKEGELNGDDFLYYENGNISSNGTYENGKLQGEYKTYYKTGELLEITTYDEHVKEGPVKVFYKIGQLEYEYAFNKGEVSGELKQYYDNGALKYTVVYNEGKKKGLSKEYFRNGQHASEYEYVDGLLENGYKTYYRNGSIKEQGDYKNGTLIQEQKDFFEDGILYSLSNYDEEGKLNGIYRQFDRDEKRYYELDYKKGHIIAYSFFNKEGKIIKEATKQKGKFNYTGFHPDGVIKGEGVYNYKGGKEGLWKFYDKNGTLEYEELYKDGEMQGKAKEYYAFGGVYKISNNNAGDLDGYYAKYHKNGQIMQDGFMINDNAEGTWTSYYQDGIIKSRRYYRNGVQDGYQEYYAVNGKLSREYYYRDGAEHNAAYYDSLGKVIQYIELKNGTGEYVRKYPNAKTEFKGNYIGGLAHGKFTWYYPNGNINSHGEYFNDNKHGKWTGYYVGGQISSDKEYYYGMLHGVQKYYFENGVLKEETEYKYDNKTGEQTFYFDNGKISSVKPYYLGNAHGEAKYYNELGGLDHIRYYEQGKIIGYSYLDKNNNPVTPIPIKNETAKVINYYPNGQISRQFEIVKGDFRGEYLKYFSNGQLCEKDNYINGQLHGESMEYYPNGKLKSKEMYSYDERNGKCEYYYPNEKIKKIEIFKLDNRHGRCKYYAENGQLTSSRYYYDGTLIDIE